MVVDSIAKEIELIGDPLAGRDNSRAIDAIIKEIISIENLDERDIVKLLDALEGARLERTFDGRNSPIQLAANSFINDIYHAQARFLENVSEIISEELMTKFSFDDLLETIKDKIPEEAYQARNRECYVYFIRNTANNRWKIGISENPPARCKALQTAAGDYLEVENSVAFPSRYEALQMEQGLHILFSEYRKIPKGRKTEWFYFGDDNSLADSLRNADASALKRMVNNDPTVKCLMGCVE